MTDLSITEIYAIGAPIVLAMILFEALFSSAYNKNLYKKHLLIFLQKAKIKKLQTKANFSFYATND